MSRIDLIADHLYYPVEYLVEDRLCMIRPVYFIYTYTPSECLIGYFLNSPIENLFECATDKGLNMERQGTSAEAQDLRISG